MRNAGLFMIPEESMPPKELTDTYAYARKEAGQPAADFVEAVVDPLLNAVVCAAARPHPGLPGPTIEARQALADTALQQGPGALSASGRKILLDDPLAMSRLHFTVWTSGNAHPEWHERIYRESDARLANAS